MRQYLIPGVGYINEATQKEYLIPGSIYVNETAPQSAGTSQQQFSLTGCGS